MAFSDGRRWFAEDFFHTNYWNINYWAGESAVLSTGGDGSCYFAIGFFALGYWHQRYWFLCGGAPAVVVGPRVFRRASFSPHIFRRKLNG